MLTKLNNRELRVLACLVEKELTTPDHYPLTLNSLVAACNQKTNRDPVETYSAETVEAALGSLRDKNLAYVFYGSSGRVPKYKHMFPSYYELEPREVAVLAVLILRGAQTAGELNQRTGRLYAFDGLGAVNKTLDCLIRREDPLVQRLEKLPGKKEVRFAHLLSEGAVHESASEVSGDAGADRLEETETRVRELERELRQLKEEFEAFRDQF